MAQRVCPIPVLDFGSGLSSMAFSRLASLPARLSEKIAPSATTAIPAESYPRYSSRRSPSMTTSRACWYPTYPTIPHMHPSLGLPRWH